MATEFREIEVILNGSKRLVAWPYEDQEVLADEAIKLDVYDILEPLFEHCSEEFWITFTNALWDRGLIRQTDFQVPAAQKRIKQALTAAIRNDVLSILSVLQE